MHSDNGRSLRCTEEFLTGSIMLTPWGARVTDGRGAVRGPSCVHTGAQGPGVLQAQVLLASRTRGFINGHLDFASWAEGASTS